MKKIAVLVSGNGSNLQALINSCNNNMIKNGRIDFIISSNDHAFALKRAKIANIKSFIICKKNYKDNDQFNTKLIECLEQNKPDLIVLAGFIHIIPKRLTQMFKNKIINIHPSLIPSFCGKGYFGINVHKKVLESGVKITGATVHFVNEGVDTGPIIIQKSVDVKQNDTAESLQLRVMQQAEWLILPKAVNLFCSNNIEIKNNKTIIKGIENEN